MVSRSRNTTSICVLVLLFISHLHAYMHLIPNNSNVDLFVNMALNFTVKVGL